MFLLGLRVFLPAAFSVDLGVGRRVHSGKEDLMSDNINGAEAAAAAEDTAAMTEQPAADDGGEPKKPLKLDYAQTFKVGFAFAIIMIFWTAYDFVVPLLLEHAYGLS